MSRAVFLKRLRKYHKWPSIILALFILGFVVSGIVMNHRDIFSGIDVPRKYLLKEYKYDNWNNAAVKSACWISPDSILVYGNIGVWLTDSAFNGFCDFNAGFPDGNDNRKIFKIHLSENGNLYAGTLFGLYCYEFRLHKWMPVVIPDRDPQVVDIAEKDGSLYFLTRSFLFTSPDSKNNPALAKMTLPPPDNYDNKESLFKTLWVIHSGEIGELAGKLFIDLMALVFIFLTLTGWIYWLFPGWIKRRKQRRREVGKLVSANRFSLKWHNKAGVWAVVFLLIMVITGMFLRPPLLITIANSRITKIPFSLLDSPNPWFDKLRRIIYDEEKRTFLIGTNEGIFFADTEFRIPLVAVSPQPPISVMGINVFENAGRGNYLVGSFSGTYLWNTDDKSITDIYHPMAQFASQTAGNPLSDNMAAGYIGIGDRQYIFDYNRGAEALLGTRSFPSMPEEIIQRSPMSLWNLALEFHTGRFYSVVFGKFYILFIPFFGIAMCIVLVTGFWLWLKIYRKRKGRRL